MASLGRPTDPFHDDVRAQPPQRRPAGWVPIGPTLTAVLDWARYAEGLTGGVVDIGLLDARLAAEGRGRARPRRHGRRASLAGIAVVVTPASGARRGRASPGRDSASTSTASARAGSRTGRSTGLAPYPAAVVDADGDIAIRLDPGPPGAFGVADPDLADHDLADPRADPSWRDGSRSRTADSAWRPRGPASTAGIARAGRTHHLIDPRTARSAVTDVIQATVLARTAREAEALAKTAVILGSDAGLDFLDRVGVDGAILLTDRGELLIHPATMRWLA